MDKDLDKKIADKRPDNLYLPGYGWVIKNGKLTALGLKLKKKRLLK
jgi:hypothetical protein